MKKFYYEVEGRTIYDKYKAIETNKTILFKPPSTYDNFDFSVEPKESLPELLKEEAQRIRDEYRFVRLYYSGGADSQLMLETFLENKIHIDEIICLKSGFTGSDTEIDDYAIPFLNTLHLPKTKVTIWNHTLEDYENFYSRDIKEKMKSECITWDQKFRLTIQMEFYRPELYHGHVANLHGYDKAKVIQMDGKWYTYFLDIDIEPTQHTYHFFSRNPKVQSKQAHLFKSSMRHNDINEKNIWEHEKEWNLSIGRQVENMPFKQMYFGTGKNYVPFNDRKMFYLNYKEKWALEKAVKTMPDVLNKWCDNMDYLRNAFNGNWWNGTPEQSTTGIFSDFYCLDDNSRKTVDELWPNGFY